MLILSFSKEGAIFARITTFHFRRIRLNAALEYSKELSLNTSVDKNNKIGSMNEENDVPVVEAEEAVETPEK